MVWCTRTYVLKNYIVSPHSFDWAFVFAAAAFAVAAIAAAAFAAAAIAAAAIAAVAFAVAAFVVVFVDIPFAAADLFVFLVESVAVVAKKIDLYFSDF